MLALLESGQAMLNRSDGVAGALDDDVDLGQLDQSLPVVGNPGAAAAQCLLGRIGLQLARIPADAGQVGTGGIGTEVGNGHKVHAGGAWYLGQIHGPELARAYQADAYVFAVGRALLKLLV